MSSFGGKIDQCYLLLMPKLVYIKLCRHLMMLYSQYRLTFWLSNSVVLRAIIKEAAGNLHHLVSAGPHIEINGVRKKADSKSSSLKWESSPKMKENKFGTNFGDWEDPQTFTTALEKIEAWIFSRIIESVWWQVKSLCSFYNYFHGLLFFG